ncbi:alpha/beta hydrolase [Kitasatospora aureofaciens]|uniref:alpha/beta hydrolase family protein n=1 Tax=Kitasatospora aureofaciens TaxID=1894 RepID=UPI001C459DE1|nr:alpha/beta hydrolase [Kitasatospora aureofaciens]MBV6698181.1 alpha/beta hydrolase [Kitasatospora aureofaciens]
MTGIRRTAAAAALLLALPLSVVAAAPALATPTAPVPATAPATATVPAGVHVDLPRPTGPHAVGREILHLVDQDRPDPWVPSAGPRRLMVSMYYPAKAGTGGPAPYMTPEAARLMLDGKLPGNTIPTEAVTGTGTWAESDAHPEHGRYPLVLLSPGFTMPRTELTSLAEDLASRGYVVALVDHTYENTGTTFPDGRTLPCAICGTFPPGGPEAVDASRAKDMSFVVDRLTAHPHPAWRYARMIDADRIGMAGHSIGGSAAIPALLTDDRIQAGVNLDGTMDYKVPDTGLDGKPFMMIGHPLGGGHEDPTWTDAWAKLDGWKRWLTVAGSNHGTFTDNPLFFEKLGLPQPPGTTITAERGVQLTREYVAAFFDLQLKGIDQPILDGPTPDNPEIGFHP